LSHLWGALWSDGKPCRCWNIPLLWRLLWGASHWATQPSSPSQVGSLLLFHILSVLKILCFAKAGSTVTPYHCPPLEVRRIFPLLFIRGSRGHRPRESVPMCIGLIKTWWADEEGRLFFLFLFMEEMNYSLERPWSEFYVDLIMIVWNCRDCSFNGPFVVFAPIQVSVEHLAHIVPPTRG